MENNQPQHQFKAIKRTFEFESIYKNGKKVRLSNWLMVVFTDNKAVDLQSGTIDQIKKPKSLDSPAIQNVSVYGVAEKSESAYGITVSRKVGKAVLRNKLKRWVRNSAQFNTWPKRLTGKRVVFIFRPQGKDFYDKITYADFKAALETLR